MSKQVINSHCPEFGYELLSVLPYAYNLYLKGQLSETISAYDTSCLYFFSPKHTEVNTKRSWDNMKKLWNVNFPNINIHRKDLDWNLFSPPPFKKFYSEKSIKFEKEAIVIFNRYNKEWNEPPINYLDLKTLDTLFSMLSNEYQVIYINLNKGDKYFDGAKPLKLNDDEILKKYPKVYSLYDVMGMYPNLSINEIQLRIFANCSKYISSNGGQLILSAYFGGENIVFSKKCRELDPKVNSFYKWYHKLGDGIFQHVDTYEDLIKLVKEKWVLKKPLINILIRTSGRPNYFNKCMESIYNQKYKNWNVIVGVDDLKSLKYTQPHKCMEVRYDYSNFLIPDPPNSIEYGTPFKYNLYLNDLQSKVNDGYVLYLDDDDSLYDSDSLLKLANSIKSDDDFIIWRVKFPNRLVPSDDNFGKPPVVKDISGIGYSFHIKNKELWEPYKRGDYRIAKKLYKKHIKTIFLNEIITKLQREVEDGFGKKDDIPSVPNKSLSIIIPTYNTPKLLLECLDSVLKSIENLNIEILVGIDGCEKTLNDIQDKQFDSRINFYFFDRNLGPYIIKNTLSSIAKSDNLLFFDSDDIMLDNLINESIEVLKIHKMYKPKYFDSTNVNEIKNPENLNSNKFGEGVFAIDKKTFLSLNGFEGWRCAADSDFMSRFYKRNISFTHGQKVSFLRRIHPNSLTSLPETNYSSKLRAHYYSLSKKPRPNGVCEKFETYPFIPVDVNYHQNFQDYKNNFKEKLEIEKQKELAQKTLSSVRKNTNQERQPVDYDRLNKILHSKKVYVPKEQSEKPKIIQNVPQDRNKLIEIKKDSNLDALRSNLKGKPNRRHNLPNIFGKK